MSKTKPKIKMLNARILFKQIRHQKIIKASLSTSGTPTVLMTWGVGTDGQLGHAKFHTTQTGLMMENVYVQEEPRKLLRSKRFNQIAIGESFTLGLNSDGDMFGWGKGFVNQDAESKEPAPFAVGSKFSSVSAGTQHAAAIDNDGQIYTWGHGGSWMSGGGFLGHGSRDSVDQPRLVEAFRDYGAKASMVSCGKQHTVILTDDGEVLSCGVGEYGLLGNGSSMDSTVPVPVDSLSDLDIVQIAAGYDHTLVLTSDGSIYSWGRNSAGQLGHSDSNIDIYSMEEFPRLIDSDSFNNAENESDMSQKTLEKLEGGGIIRFNQIAAGNGRSAAITTTGSLYVWGSRISHQPRLISKRLFNGQKAKKVAIGGDVSRSAFAVLTEDGSLWTFGDAKSHLLGLGNLSGKQPLPQQVTSLENRVVDISCGFGLHMMAFIRAEE